ncbi:hypothetical protein SBBP1_250017 [Burkholderiales bacterium]|nr:hypothetical protein SBBP1_250017 [Burkholderiales bacterium]
MIAAEERGLPAWPAETTRGYRDFRPPPLPTGTRVTEHPSESMRLGSAWHALLQQAGTPQPATLARAQLARTFLLPDELAGQAIVAAERVRTAPSLERFFRPGVRADNELELIDRDGDTLRIDRLVEFEDAVWVLDYKWRLGEDAMPAYRRQLRRYAQTLMHAGVQKPVRLLLIAADATAVEVPAGPDADGEGPADAWAA